MQNTSSRAQGTVEYLVIVAIIVTISLFIAGTSTNFLDEGTQVHNTSSEIKNLVGVGGISVIDVVMGVDENGVLVLSNTGSEPITINKIKFGGVDHNFSEPIVFGGQASFWLENTSGCTGEEQSYELVVYYENPTGLEKIADFETITVDCILVVPFTENFIEEDASVEETGGEETVTYSVVYFGNGNTGGSVPTDANNYEVGNIVVVLDNTGSLTKTSYVFGGWNTLANRSGTNRAAGSTFTMGSEDVNLYAKWGYSCPGGMSGIGLSGDECLITSWADLNAIRNDLNLYYKLTANLSSATAGYAGIGSAWVPIGTDTNHFGGNFDGNGYTISNLIINFPASNNIGFFAYMDGNVSNLGLITVDVDAHLYMGGLVGRSSGNITNCYSSGSVTGNNDYVGGLVGIQIGGVISNCHSSVSALTTIGGKVGGLVGSLGSGTITNCYATGNVSSPGMVGGLVGYQGQNTTISKSYATGNVASGGAGGGLAGYSYGSISDSYSTGAVTSTTNFGGGFIGVAGGTITNSYSTGNVNGYDRVGGFAAYVDSRTVSNSYSTGSVSGHNYVGGFAGASSGTISNCGWWSGAGPANAVGDPVGSISYAEASKSAYYSSTHNVYDQNVPYWAFGVDGNWTARDSNYPILTWQTQ